MSYNVRKSGKNYVVVKGRDKTVAGSKTERTKYSIIDQLKVIKGLLTTNYSKPRPLIIREQRHKLTTVADMREFMEAERRKSSPFKKYLKK